MFGRKVVVKKYVALATGHTCREGTTCHFTHIFSSFLYHTVSVLKIKDDKMARSCNVATGRLVYQDAHGLSAAETWTRFWIGGRTKPKDAELCPR